MYTAHHVYLYLLVIGLIMHLKYKGKKTDKTFMYSQSPLSTQLRKRLMMMYKSCPSILILIALAGAAHGFCAHGIGGVGEYSGQCSDSIGKHNA